MNKTQAELDAIEAGVKEAFKVPLDTCEVNLGHFWIRDVIKEGVKEAITEAIKDGTLKLDK